MTIAEARKLPRPPAALLQDASLFLDFDGTLVEIAASPGAVRVERRLRDLVRALSTKLSGRLAIVSGRPAADIAALFEGMTIVIAGSHGAELLWADGHRICAAPMKPDCVVRARISSLQLRHPGILVEEKPFGLALHFRGAPEAEADCRAVAGTLAAHTGLALQTGKKVIELRPRGADKGTAVLALMARAPMAGGRLVFVGDDDTDEAGFAAASLLGGAGVLVGPSRHTAASYRLASVGQTLAWLEEAMETMS